MAEDLTNDEPNYKEKSIKCEFCETIYKNDKSCKTHQETVHREKCFSCDECASIFAKNSQLQEHVRIIHKKERIYFPFH